MPLDALQVVEPAALIIRPALPECLRLKPLHMVAQDAVAVVIVVLLG